MRRNKLKNFLFLAILLAINNCCVVKKVNNYSGLFKNRLNPSFDMLYSSPCPPNIDSLYDRQEILGKFADIFNILENKYDVYERINFKVEYGKPYAFFVWDLIDTTNNSKICKKCINCVEFYNYHIYHICPFEYSLSQSQILILLDGELKIFNAVNCEEKGDDLEDVLEFLNIWLEGNPDKNKIIKRVKRYRYYGMYDGSGSFGIHCD